LHEEIFAYFSYDGATNAYTEALNGLVKLVNKVGRGYSFDAIRAKLLYGTGRHKTQRPKYNKSWTVHEMGIPEPDINYGNDLTTLITELEQEVENDESTSKSE
jgi:transposase